MSYAKYGQTISEFTKRFRLEAGLTQRELADAMGVHSQYVSNIERGRHPRPVTFASLLLEHVDAGRSKFLIDLMKEAAAERVAHKMGVRLAGKESVSRTGTGKTKAKRAHAAAGRSI
jgi:transcriptional regulator with XRE-family HTH domain